MVVCVCVFSKRCQSFSSNSPWTLPRHLQNPGKKSCRIIRERQCPRNDSPSPPRMSPCSTVIPTRDLHQVHYYLQCQLISAISLLLMHSDRSPAARTPLCLLIGQPDGQLSSGGDEGVGGGDISVSNQISPSKSNVCLKGRAPGAKRLSGAHVPMAARARVEMKINEGETACV